MKLTFNCTLDDYTEAMRLFRKPAPGHGPGWAERLLFLWVLLGAIGLLLVVAVVEAVLRGGPGARGALTTWALAILTPWIPSLVVLTFLWLAACGAVAPTERRPLRRLALGLAAVLLLVNVATVVISGPAAPEPERSPTGTVSEDGSLLALLPWLILFLFIWVAFFRFLRGVTRRNWDAQPHLRLPQTLELTPQGLRFDDGLCAHDYRWAGFAKWREGGGLFLLYVSDVGFHMVPKRAMAGPKEVDQFRYLLWQHVRPIDPRPFGSPVHPAAPVTMSGQQQPPPLPTY